MVFKKKYVCRHEFIFFVKNARVWFQPSRSAILSPILLILLKVRSSLMPYASDLEKSIQMNMIRKTFW